MEKSNIILLFLLISFFKLSFSQEKKYPTHKVNGRIHYDMSYYKLDTLSTSEVEFRRIFIGVKGKIRPKVSYFARIDFAKGKLGLRNMYVALEELPIIKGKLFFGNFEEVPSLDMAISSRDINMEERAFITHTLPSRWRSGIKYKNTKLLNSKATFQIDWSFNDNVFTNTNITNNRNIVARITYAPIYKEEKSFLVHLGAHYENRKFKENIYSIKFTPANSRYAINPIKYKVDYAVLNQDYGVEFATTFGPFGIASEYEISTILRDSIIKNNLYSLTTYYVDLFFFITGEQKSYKKGVFSQVKPKNEFDPKNKHFGAWEILFRYDVVDFSNAFYIPSFYGDKINKQIKHYIFGVNFYPTTKIRFMYNYIITDISENHTLTSHTFRVAYDF